MNIREEQQRILTATKKHLEGALQSADTSLRIVQSVSLPNAYIYDLAERCERSIRTISPLLAYTRYQPEDDSAPADPAEVWDIKMQRINPTHFLFRLPTLLPHRKEPSSARGAYYSPCAHAIRQAIGRYVQQQKDLPLLRYYTPSHYLLTYVHHLPQGASRTVYRDNDNYNLKGATDAIAHQLLGSDSPFVLSILNTMQLHDHSIPAFTVCDLRPYTVPDLPIPE